MDSQRYALCLLVIFAAVDYISGQCCLHYKDDFDGGSAQPVFITNGKYLTPNGNNCNLQLQARQEIVIACPGKENLVSYNGPSNGQKRAKLKEWVASCVSGKTFTGSQGNFNLKHLSCDKNPEVSIKNSTQKCADQISSSSHNYEIGYMVQGKLRALYEVCFDHILLTTYFVKHVIQSHSCFTQKAKQQSFQINGMFNKVNMNDLYQKKHQEERFIEIFGPTQNYLQKDTQKHALERGHLASRADYTMAAELRATYQYINAAPQWREVNIPRWSNLETALRKYVKKTGVSVTVYTGTHGVLSLAKPNNADQSIYLYRDSIANKNYVPVPLYFYKVVDEPGQPRIAYVTINWDSFDTAKLNLLRFCNDPCRLSWKDKGTASFCCNYNRFTTKIGYSPN